MPVVVHIYNLNATAGTATAADTASVSVRWAHLAHPMAKGSTPPSSAVPSSSLAPALPAPELQRRALQNSLKRGWSTCTARVANECSQRRRANGGVRAGWGGLAHLQAHPSQSVPV